MENAPNRMRNHDHNGVVLDGTAIEQSICGLSGVCGARVVVTQNDIKEVHVLASPRRAPKKIIRDIESVVLVQHGYRVDYRRISLAQVADVAQPHAERVALQSVEQIRTPQGVEVVVTLVDGEHLYRGTYVVRDDVAGAAAQATVAALNTMFARPAPLALRGCHAATLGERQVVTVYVAHNGGDHVLGTAFVQSTPPAAAARAVLGATDRHLANWLHHSMTPLLARTIGA